MGLKKAAISLCWWPCVAVLLSCNFSMCLLTSCKNSPKPLVLIFHYLVLWGKALVKEEMVSPSYIIKLLSCNNFSMCLLTSGKRHLVLIFHYLLLWGEALVKEKMVSPSSHRKQYGGKHSMLQIPLPDDSIEKFILPEVCMHICLPQSLTDENKSASAISHCNTWDRCISKGLRVNPSSIFQKCVFSYKETWNQSMFIHYPSL